MEYKYNIEVIKRIIRESPATPVIYFYGHHPKSGKITQACFSQWYNCCFVVDEINYHTAEQYMMSQKALLFGDTDVCQQIMESDNPRDYKALGRKVRNFRAELLDEKKYGIVVAGNIAKFSQNPELKDYLLGTGDAILVEASPYDRVWGVGIDKETALSTGVSGWKGEKRVGLSLSEFKPGGEPPLGGSVKQEVSTIANSDVSQNAKYSRNNTSVKRRE